ncbi:GspH/FimT family pseudopilin [Alteromonas sp. CYL-A6]|uniref:GspH/FimT family pseudopilin n=1 Tax=Alteromonas nitratireducens TaxID=3390813 RepID=UPI0034B3A888
MVRQRGLTLLEMLITLAISAILLTVVAPNVQSILASNKITSDINNLSAIAQHARFSAINDQQDVVLCPTANYSTCSSSWRLAKMVFADVNGNGNRDDGEPLIATADPISKSNTISGLTGSLTFQDNGGVGRSAVITLCPQSGSASDASAVLISLYGRIVTAKDSDGDGIKEDTSGTSLSCS